MDDIKPQRGHYAGNRAQNRPAATKRPYSHRPERHSGQMYWLARTMGKISVAKKLNLWHRLKTSSFAKWHSRSRWHRIYALVVLVLFIVSTIGTIVQPFLDNLPYGIPKLTRSILPTQSPNLGQYLKFNMNEQKYVYNDGYSSVVKAASTKTGSGEPRFTASFGQDPTKGVMITDPVNNIDFTLKPKFRLGSAKQEQNQIIYPLLGADGFLVYTAQIASVKEDIVLQSSKKNDMTFDYELDLAEGLEARMEKDGSVGVYGSSLPLYGNVSTGTEKDAELLDKARKNSEKNKFIFGIPAPYVKEAGQETSSVSTRFELNGKTLRVVAEGLKKASYPLTVDPSVYIESAAQLMRGNNESNVAFDVATEQFKKGSTTGARIDEWTETGTMNDAVYDQGTAAAGGYIYRAGGRSGRIMPWIASLKESSISTSATTFTMSMPDVRPAGDLYIAIIARDGTGAVTAPGCSCWTQLANTREHLVYWHTGGASEPASYNWTIGTGVQWSGAILRIKDAATSPTFTTTTQNNASDANPGFAAVTPTSQGALVLRSASFDDDLADDHGYSPLADHDDVVTGHSNGTAGVGYAASVIDSPPTSGAAAAAANMNPDAGVLDSYGSSSIAIYGNSATPAYSSSVQWAHFNSSNGSIDSPTPGTSGGACSNWCTNSAYNLPEARVGMQFIAYNGYLYAMGGSDGTNLESTVWIAKLGINGEPSLWHPTDPNEATWSYWYSDTALSSARAYHSAYAYNGKMYILGGDNNTTANSGAITTVEVADILPNGKLGSWSSGPALPTARYGAAVQAYNGYLYVLGGNNNGTMVTGTTSGVTNASMYSRINSDGTLNSWKSAAADGSSIFTTPRSSHGGLMSGIWGGYIYLAGGCSTVNASGICTTIQHDVQLASINADGTLDVWNTMAYLRHKRAGSSFIAWQNNLYRFGGCSKYDASNDDCYAAHLDIQYGTINQDGDASTVSKTSPSGTAPCTGGDPYDCDLPPIGDGAGQGGQMLGGTAILNGYMYVIGGCADLDCSGGAQVSGNVSYVGISSDGKLKRPPSCQYSTYGSWCVDDTNRVNGTTGVAAMGVTVFGGNIYVVGGLSGGGNVTNVYRNSVNGDGSLVGTWTSQTFANLGITQSVAYTFAYSRANPSNATYPGNLYLFGGCGETTGAGCTNNNYRTEVWKCNILTTGALEESDANDCDTANQLQIDSDPGTGGNQGLGIHAGTVYANYIYLIGGLNGGVDLDEVRYAKFDNSNNVVAVSGGAWVESPVKMNVGRRRGTAFGFNGYLYAVGGYEGTATRVLDTIEFAKINVSDGSLVSSDNLFTNSAVTINQRWGLSLAVSNSFAYVIGGCKTGASPDGCTAFDTTVQTFQVYNNDSGTPSGYTAAAGGSMYTTDRLGAGVAILNGYIYVAGGCVSTTDCTDATDNVQFAPLDAYGGVGTWANTTDATLPGQRAYGQLEAAGGTLYFIGGQDDTSTNESADVYYGTPSVSTGNVTTWSDASNDLPAARTQHSATVWNNRIYVTGGLDGSAAAQTTIYASPSLASGGDIGSAWTTTGMTAFSVARSGHVAVAYANNLYVLGGYTGSAYLSDVQFTQINSDGTLDSWAYSTNLPTPLRQADGFALNGYMYIFGGRSSTNNCTARTLVAPISANTTIASGNNPTGIGEWYQTNRNFDGGRYGVGAANYQGKAYVLGGGCQGIVMQDDFDATHTAGEWSNTTGMTAGTTCQSTSTSNVFYLTTGGTTNQAATKDVNVASGGTVHFKLYMPLADTGGCFRGESTGGFLSPTVNDNVELEYSTNGGGAWTQIGGDYAFDSLDPLKNNTVTIPAGAQTSATRFRWIMRDGEANDSFAIEDVSIVATGSTTIAYATNSRVSYTTLLSQPQIANYSRLIDADKDVTPTKWLMNGLDNSIGARWQMRYRSMNDPTNTGNPCGGSVMTGYGQETNFGDVTLGTPAAYTVKNGAGTDIGCGRYFFMNISIDASQTYGYPDDIARGPTLDNIIFFFNSNPGKRLIHGKTFLEGIQQPLDTQPGP